jgi:poly(A) polymerase
MSAPETIAILDGLCKRGDVARFVGGCVRDAVLGRPIKDIDIATPLPPESVIALLGAADIHVIPTGIEHGTVTAVIGKAHFEITSLRRDVETYGRKAKVAFTDDWLEDAGRRDFTINTLFCDGDGTLYDPCGGLADLEAGLVRFVGDPGARIKEDVLRILRFFRFHAWYGKGVADVAALAACRAHADTLPGLSPERVWSEIRRLLMAPDPVPVLEMMGQAGVLQQILPEAGDLGTLGQLVLIERDLNENDPLRRLAAILFGCGDRHEDCAHDIAVRLHLSNAERDRLATILAFEPQAAPEATQVVWRLALYKIGPARFRDRVLLGWADAGAGSGTGADDAPWREMLGVAADWQPVEMPLRGRDVLDLGVPAGEKIGELLAKVEDWWIVGDFAASREACLEKLKEFEQAGD